MNRKYILIFVGLICLYAILHTIRYKFELEHGTPDGKVVIENHSTHELTEGDELIIEEITTRGTIILVPKDQSNLIP